MSRIDELLEQLCPDGVPVVRLSEIAQLLRGNGMPKTVLTNEGVGAIHYGQIYTRYGAWAAETFSFVSPETAVKLVQADPGDIIITNTSENVDEVCKAVAWLGKKAIVTGGHATVIKHSQNPKYLSYWFQSESFLVQKKVLASGTKVIDVSAKQLMKVMIPVPPLEVQREIVRILDQFTQLEAELEAELEARRRQYDHYLRLQMMFPAEIPRVNLGELVEVRSGWGFPKAEQGLTGGGLPFYKVSDMNLRGNETIMRKANNYVSDSVAEKLGLKPAPAGTVIFPKIGAAVATNKKRVLSAPAAYDNNVMGLIPGPKISSRFLYHWMQTFDLTRLANDSGAVPSIRKSEAEKVLVPLVPLSDQCRIAQALDSLSALVNDLSVGLPAELAARRKQYKYYRDRLLTFKEEAA